MSSQKLNNKVYPIFDIKTSEGFEKVYNTYSDSLFVFCKNYLEDPEMAKDIVQEVFANLWKKRHSITITGKIENYLVRSAKFKMIDTFRANERREKLSATVDFDELSTTSPEEYVVFAQLKDSLFKIFNRLPKKTRRIFFLSRKKGLTNREIAMQLSISEKTVEYHISNSLKKIKKIV